MSATVKYGPDEEPPISEYEQIMARMKKRDEYLTRRLRRMRAVVRVLSLGVGFSHRVAG